MTIEEAFTAELQALLDKYDAELSIQEERSASGRRGMGMVVDIPGLWDENHNISRPYCEIDLGTFMCPTPKKPTGA